MEKDAESHNVAFKEVMNLESFPTPSPAASNFASALNIIYSTQSGRLAPGREACQNLRLTCKAIRDVVDVHVESFTFLACEAPFPMNAISSWRWDNVIKAGLEDDFEDLPTLRLQQALEGLVALPLPKLRSLEIQCCSLLPFANANFPMLETLILKIIKTPPERGVDPFSPYPSDLHFPKMPLKVLELDIEVDDTARIAFLGPLLRSCDQLTKIMIGSGSKCYRCDEQMAEMWHSAPLPRLETLYFYAKARSGFYPKLFNRDYPALKTITVFSPWVGDISFLASTNWVRRVEEFVIWFLEEQQIFVVEELRCFLKALENGGVKRLDMYELQVSTIVESFRGLRIESLKKLTVDDLNKFEGEDTEDVSDHVNVVFDTCYFPKLEELRITAAVHYDEDPPGWVRPSCTSAQRIANDDKFPLLQKLSFDGFTISRDVIDYLAHFREQTGCYIDPGFGPIEARDFPPHHQIFLERLEVSSDDWRDFCYKNVGRHAYHEEMYWHSMSDVSFKRIAFAVMLEKARNVAALEIFMHAVEAEETDAVMTTEGLDYLKTLLRTAEYGANGFDSELVFRWGNMDALIDYKKGLPIETLPNLRGRSRGRSRLRFLV
jgi:hypothetical protein